MPSPVDFETDTSALLGGEVGVEPPHFVELDYETCIEAFGGSRLSESFR